MALISVFTNMPCKFKRTNITNLFDQIKQMNTI